MNDSFTWVTLEAIYQMRLRDEPHLSRQRFREEMTPTPRRQVRNSVVEGERYIRGAERTPENDASLRVFVVGWNDIYFNEPYQKAYHVSPKGAQENYEMGRCCATIVRSMQELPPWTSHMSFRRMVEEGLLAQATIDAVVAEQKWFLADTKEKEDA